MSGIFDSILGAIGGGGGDRNPAMILGDLLGGGGGGLSGVVQAFEQNGLGEIAQSWVGTGANLPVSAEQIEGVLGQGQIADLAAKLGIDPSQAAGQLSTLLPDLIDKLTPDGTLPSAGGLGGLGDLLGRFKL